VVATPRPKLSAQLPGVDVPLVRAVNDADVSSFKAQGFEACFECEALGPVWIVSEYTDQPRKELKIEHAMVLAAVGAVFPDAKLTAFTRPAERALPKSEG
jgi:hypothetical protein